MDLVEVVVVGEIDELEDVDALAASSVFVGSVVVGGTVVSLVFTTVAGTARPLVVSAPLVQADASNAPRTTRRTSRLIR